VKRDGFEVVHKFPILIWNSSVEKLAMPDFYESLYGGQGYIKTTLTV